MDGIYVVSEISRIIAPIFGKYGISRTYLFGSCARRDALPESDIDLRIDGGQVRSMLGFGGFYSDLTEALHKPVDLVTTEALNHRANAERTGSSKRHIKENEKLIYEGESRWYFRTYPSLLYRYAGNAGTIRERQSSF